MTQKWEVAQPSASGAIPSLDSFVNVVMPPAHGERNEASTHMLTQAPEALETTTLTDSPDDAFASSYPLKISRIPAVVSEYLDELVAQMSESLESSLYDSAGGTPVVRYGVARREGESVCAVWVEARESESGAYLLPHIQALREPSLRWRSPHLDHAHGEKFFDGPVRLIALYDEGEESRFRYLPWFSSASVGEAEEHFVRRIRAGSGEPSWIASEAGGQLYKQRGDRKLIGMSDVGSDERAEWEEALGAGTITSLSVDTAGRRVYEIDYPQHHEFQCVVRIGADAYGTIEVRASWLSRS